MLKFVIYQPIVTEALGHLIKLPELEANELINNCVSSGHIVVTSTDRFDAIVMYNNQIVETLHTQSIFAT